MRTHDGGEVERTRRADDRDATADVRALASLVERLRGLHAIDHSNAAGLLGKRLDVLDDDLGEWHHAVAQFDADGIAAVELHCPLAGRPGPVGVTLLMDEGCSIQHLDLAAIWGFGTTLALEPREPPRGVVDMELCRDGRDTIIASFHMGPGGTLKRLLFRRD